MLEVALKAAAHPCHEHLVILGDEGVASRRNLGSAGRLSEVDFHFWGDGLHLKARARLSPAASPWLEQLAQPGEPNPPARHRL